jgi:8-oxo-dGTP pyrophosphatase MutT (NUDIX family)
MVTVQKAGAIVLSKQDPSLVALLYRSKQDDWSFPKGHVEEGEDVFETTRREIAEETGLSVRLVEEPLPSMEYDHLSGDHVVVYMFLMQSEDDSALKAEFEGDKIVWVNSAEVAGTLSHDNLKKYYVSVYAQVESVIKNLRVGTQII